MVAGIAVAIKVGNSSPRKRWLHVPTGRAGSQNRQQLFSLETPSCEDPWGLHGCNMAPCTHNREQGQSFSHVAPPALPRL